MLVYKINDQKLFPNATEIYVDEKASISDGDPVVATIGNSLVCRLAYKTSEGYKLTHPDYSDISVPEVIGRVVRYAIPV